MRLVSQEAMGGSSFTRRIQASLFPGEDSVSTVGAVILSTECLGGGRGPVVEMSRWQWHHTSLALDCNGRRSQCGERAGEKCRPVRRGGVS